MNTQIKIQLNKEQERLEKRRAYQRQWARANPDKIKAKTVKYNQTHANEKRKWAKANPEKMRVSWTKYNNNHTDKIQKWHKDNPDKVRAFRRKYLATNVNARIARNLRSRLRLALLAQLAMKRGHLKDLIGMTSLQLRQHLEQQFQPGMTWQNYGNWHIDHIRPLAFFDLTKPEEQKRAMHYTNLAPLWAIDNLRKGAKLMV